MNTRLLFVHALSPLHAGTGQGVGVIDLPIAREKATGLPYLPGSSLKGVLRDTCVDEKMRSKIFGPDTTSAHEYAGSVQVSDQRLLLLPVRSLVGTFAWVTSPYILRRFSRDASVAEENSLPTLIPSPSIGTCVICVEDCQIIVNQQVILDDLDLTVNSEEHTDAWAQWIGEQVFPGNTLWQQMLRARFCVIHDDVMSFLLDTATEIIARIKLKEDTKTVEKGGLWYEEALPAESILAGLVVATPVNAVNVSPIEVFKVIADLLAKPLQLGGSATVGRGLCRLQMRGGDGRVNP